MEKFVELRNISKHYQEAVSVLDRISLSIQKGEILSIVGPSGCGKSTLLRCIAGLEEYEGTIQMNGDTSTENRTIVLMFQESLLFPHLTVLENVTYGLKMKKIPKKERIQSAQTMLDKVEMTAHTTKYPYELSGGQQQRVALARALVMKPDLLLLDEPFSSLDQSLRYDLRLYVRDLLVSEGVTSLFITHDKEEASFMGDRIAVMNNGEIQQVGHPEEVALRPSNRFVAHFFSEGLLVEDGFISSRDLEVFQKNTKHEMIKVEGRVVNKSMEHGERIYHIHIPTTNQTITLPSKQKFEDGEPIYLQYSKSDIHYINHN
ncbi:ABC transporter ATP-binding protein [Pseudalkalibacillus berkeleyi]|uniref:ABC transporter ATP-binding protein n=1 Tax=Pseudalkalibacillus berkeleyi TaxID=1069813 RepID=A0ABS9H0X3_9BACL|nr:ABC transporter ATP-binding protein [Pseudalkalibacillus berkeleyi]MCF6137423.1 ABC transporter ATP-binding protein [Pseudalkalibacillus berkeleyi]